MSEKEQDVSSSSLYSQTILIVGIVVLMMLMGIGTLSYLHTLRLVHINQNESDFQLVDGLAHSLTDSVLARDYSALVSQLKLVLLNRNIHSVMVADTHGKVLSHVGWNNQSGLPVEIFSERFIELPQEDTDKDLDLNSSEMTSQKVIWKRIGSGMAIGWLRTDLRHSKTEEILHDLRVKTIVIGAVSALTTFVFFAMFLLRNYRKVSDKEKLIFEKTQLLEFDAYHDALTQLPNRKLLGDRLQQEIYESDRTHKMLVVCFMDLDGFKQVNDQYGHDVGDQLLIEVKNRLLNTLRRTDTVSRLGGDEFVLLLPEIVDWYLCEQLLNRILGVISQDYTIGLHTIEEITASIGVAIYPSDTKNSAELIERADAAMYAAKHAGKGCIYLYSDLRS